MKNIIFVAGLALCVPVMADQAPHETKKVCVDVKDKEGKPVKDAKGNTKQTCKTVREHQKLDGTRVPEKK